MAAITQGPEETGFEVKTYDVVKSAVLDFNKALKYMTNRLTETTSDGDLSSVVERWWSHLGQVYRGLRLSLGAEGGPEVSLFYLQIRVLDAIWAYCFSLRDGPSPWKDIKIGVMKYRINGSGDCVVLWDAILRDLEEDPAKVGQVLVSPRGSIEYNIEVAHRDVSAGTADDGDDGAFESEARPKRMASPAGLKRKHARAGQKGTATQTRGKRRASPDHEHRNADVEDDSSDFNEKDGPEGEAAGKSEEDQAGRGTGAPSIAPRADKSTTPSPFTLSSGSPPPSLMRLRKGPSGGASGPRKTHAGGGKSAKLSQSTLGPAAQRATTIPRSWFEGTRPSSRPSSGAAGPRRLLGSQSTEPFPLAGPSTQTPKLGGRSFKSAPPKR